MMAKERAKVASGKHARHLKGNAITVGNGVTWEGLFHVGKNQGQVQAVLMNPRRVDQKTLQLADLVCALLETNVITGSGTIIAK